jgi:hypothetical protein
VQGPKSAAEAHASQGRAEGQHYLDGGTGNRSAWPGQGQGFACDVGVFDRDGNELARGSVTTHPGDMSWTVTRSFEADFEDLLGKGWMDQ